MKLRNSVLAAFVLAAFFNTAATAATNPVTIPLHAENGSHEDGTATLTQIGGDVRVVLEVKNAPASAQPAHIHEGACPNVKAVTYPLNSVVSGTSTTVIKHVTINQLAKSPHAINVHESTSNLGKYVSCGNIVEPSSM